MQKSSAVALRRLLLARSGLLRWHTRGGARAGRAGTADSGGVAGTVPGAGTGPGAALGPGARLGAEPGSSGGDYRSGELWRESLSGMVGALAATRRLEAVQLDPVAVVDRNHHLVLRNRVSGYRPEHLEALYRDRLVFEYWANARCVLPIEDYGLFTPVRERRRASLRFGTGASEGGEAAGAG